MWSVFRTLFKAWCIKKRKKGAFWSSKFLFYQYQSELGLDVQVNEHTEFTGYCLSAVETVLSEISRFSNT